MGRDAVGLGEWSVAGRVGSWMRCRVDLGFCFKCFVLVGFVLLQAGGAVMSMYKRCLWVLGVGAGGIGRTLEALSLVNESCNSEFI